MTPSFRVSDAFRCIVLNKPSVPNLANPRMNAWGNPRWQTWDLWRQVVAQRESRITLAHWNGLRLGGLVSAGTGGGYSWEIDHFYLPAPALDVKSPGQPAGPSGLELLEQLTSLAGSRGAERVLLRLPSGSPAVLSARQAGFFPYFEEIRLEGHPQEAPANGHHPADGFRVSQPHDEHGLFQLFTASTPAPVRMALAPTFDRWREVQRLWPGRRREWVKEDSGKLVGWLGLFQGRDTLEGRMMAHPDHPQLHKELLELALCRPGFQRWLAPDFQPQAGELLRQRGSSGNRRL